MMYGVGLGAGPGEIVTYRVDLPLPWGRDTEVTLPMEAIMNDAWTAVEPNVSAAIARGAVIVSMARAIAPWSGEARGV